MEIALPDPPALVKSKKFGAAVIASMISFFAVREGMGIEQVVMVTGPLYAFIGAQGIADHGKSRAILEAAARRPQQPSEPPT